VEFHENFRAMDTDVDVFIEAESMPFGAFAEARLLFDQQEDRFSRFRPQSLLSRLNNGETIVDGWLAEAVSLALEAFGATGGLFNPMILPALRASGYDRTFREVAGGRPEAAPSPDPRACLRLEATRVQLLEGQVDLGGIVKGWTADLAVEHLCGRYPNVFLNAGGDIRCAGGDGAGRGWAMDILAPGERVTAWRGRLSGAIATSTTLKRRWQTTEGGTAHHLIDPRSGLPADSRFVQVTVRAEHCRVAEIWAKAVLIGGEDALAGAAAANLAVLAIANDGAQTRIGDWQA